jgi:nucleoside-diphosphate-sugar epimerase
MSRVLLTGASGFIGRHCLPILRAKGYEVHAVARRRPPGQEFAGIIWHEMDLLEPGCAAELIRQARPESLLHLAWYAVPGSFWEAAENVDWVRASLELASAFTRSRGARLVAAGSCAEYDLSSGECSEDAIALSPSTLYGASKQALGKLLQVSSAQSGLSFAWGRIFFLYGPHEHPARPLAYVVRSLLKGEPAACTEGTQILDFLHVEDVASALVALLESKVCGPVNIASGVPISLRTVFETIGRQLGRPELIQFGARESGSTPYRIWANTRRLTGEVGWAPRFTLDSGVEQTIAWWRAAAELSASTPIAPGR